MHWWFSRRNEKQEKNYAAVRSTLEKNGVETADQAEACRANMLGNAKVYSGLVIVGCILIGLVVPNTLGYALVLAACALLWIWSSTLAGRRYIRRYIDEELSKPPE